MNNPLSEKSHPNSPIMAGNIRLGGGIHYSCQFIRILSFFLLSEKRKYV